MSSVIEVASPQPLQVQRKSCTIAVQLYSYCNQVARGTNYCIAVSALSSIIVHFHNDGCNAIVVLCTSALHLFLCALLNDMVFVSCSE